MKRTRKQAVLKPHTKGTKPTPTTPTTTRRLPSAPARNGTGGKQQAIQSRGVGATGGTARTAPGKRGGSKVRELTREEWFRGQSSSEDEGHEDSGEENGTSASDTDYSDSGDDVDSENEAPAVTENGDGRPKRQHTKETLTRKLRTKRGSGTDDNVTPDAELLTPENLAKLETWMTRYDPPKQEESDDETHNTIGRVPIEWYSDYEHIGYDLNGNKIVKKPRKDSIQNFIDRHDDPDYWRTYYDEYNDRDVVLTKQDLSVVQRMKENKFPHKDFDPYAPFFESDAPPLVHPLTGKEPVKNQFIPSKWEAKRVAYLVRAIKRGWLSQQKKKQEEGHQFYDIWATAATEDETKRLPDQLPPPKLAYPQHAESYNPPREYLWSQKEISEWTKLDPEDRRQNFIPKRHGSLREVAGYENFLQERFERCLDLYLVPRKAVVRKRVKKQALLPTLPKRDELRPFPTTLGIDYLGHTDKIRTLSPDPTGQYLASGSDDKTVRVWEISTGRCCGKWNVGSIVHSVAWNPNPAVNIIAAALEDELVVFINPETGSEEQNDITNALLVLHAHKRALLRRERKSRVPILWRTTNKNLLASADDTVTLPNAEEYEEPEVESEDDEKDTEEQEKQTEDDEDKKPLKADPALADLSALDSRIQLVIAFHKPIRQVTWQAKGDHLVTIAPDAGRYSVLIHQLSKQRTQNPFYRLKGAVQTAAFHPSKPIIFVATQSYVRVYDLRKQQMIKKLVSSMRWISSIDVHNGGDNIILSSYDSKVCWFDLDLSTKPYKTLRHHRLAVRKSAFHHGPYPLFASCSDDGNVYVFHGMVYSDLMQNPLIVPVKRLKGHATVDGFNVLDCVWHPQQPWLWSAGADGVIKLWT
eukprot:TRINITY_DN1131_c0_g1_i4.p1 TRINITY_DN1131_c0_g1~~TRINITY_DN1131_c0_g1_i4.p1  ORF type:complete len:868 (+),score=143.99 TRINITY_DN1131_c0_g1_i4:131-2734(+)